MNIASLITIPRRLFFKKFFLVLSPLTILTHTFTRLFNCALSQLYSYRIDLPTYPPSTYTYFLFCYLDTYHMRFLFLEYTPGKFHGATWKALLVRGAASYIFQLLGVFFFFVSLPVTGLGIWGTVEKAVLSIYGSSRRSGYIHFMHGRMEQREMNYLIYAYDGGE